MSETLGLKNINMLTKEQYNGIVEPAKDELYAISGSGFGFPSKRYVDLTLGATGASYTAPANGWVFFSKQSTASGQYVKLNSGQIAESQYSSASNQGIRLVAPVLKGTFAIEYKLAGDTNAFKFIYAEGEE